MSSHTLLGYFSILGLKSICVFKRDPQTMDYLGETFRCISWWRHKMNPLSVLLVLLRGIHRWSVDFLTKCRWCGTLMIFVLPAWTSFWIKHYNDVIMEAMASRITSLTIVYSIVYSDADQRKHQSSATLAFVWGIHRGSVNSPHKWPVTRKMFPFDDVIMNRHVLVILKASALLSLWVAMYCLHIHGVVYSAFTLFI